jgi:hypothetical protein
MPAQASHPSGQVSADRLQEVAPSDSINFTDPEFRHMRMCSECFQLWRQFISDNCKERAPTRKRGRPRGELFVVDLIWASGVVEEISLYRLQEHCRLSDKHRYLSSWGFGNPCVPK